MAADYFCQRREVGILNIGECGSVKVDGEIYDLENLDCLYIGRGAKEISFSSASAENPAKFYFVSYPAHKEFPTTLAKKADANVLNLGCEADANKRKIYQYIHENGIKSCQLVMGFTALESGNVWNTMPCHTHERRTEVYMYFGFDESSKVFHFMGRRRNSSYCNECRAGCVVADVVDSFCLRHKSLHFLLGAGRRKPAVRRYGSHCDERCEINWSFYE